MLNMLRDLTQAIENLHAQTMHQDQFLSNMFRDYRPYSHNTFQLIMNIKNGIQCLEQMSLSNSEQAHRLSPTEVGVDENGNLRRGEVPQQVTPWTLNSF